MLGLLTQKMEFTNILKHVKVKESLPVSLNGLNRVINLTTKNFYMMAFNLIKKKIKPIVFFNKSKLL